MSREIKLRAWDGYKMHYPNVCEIGVSGVSGKTSIAFRPADKSGGYLTTAYVMQFTGLLDKNSNEIYEGDILRYEPFTGEVVWDYSGLMLKINKKIYAIWRNCEVIGNIYENPELLE